MIKGRLIIAVGIHVGLPATVISEEFTEKGESVEVGGMVSYPALQSLLWFFETLPADVYDFQVSLNLKKIEYKIISYHGFNFQF